MSFIKIPRHVGHRFSEVTSDDHSAWVWVATLLGVTFSLLFLCLRAYVKWKRRAVDDCVVVIAYVFASCHWITECAAVNNGLGRSSRFLTDVEKHRASKAAFASRILLLIAIWLTKCSMVLLIRQIFTRDFQRTWLLCNAVLAFFASCGLFAVLASSVKCSANSVLAKNADALCPDQAVLWMIITILDVLSELIIVVLVFVFLRPIQMGMRDKALVIIAFFVRLGCIIFSCVFLSTFLTHLKHSAAADGNPSLSIAVSSAWLESILTFGLMSATIPCMKSLMEQFQTGGVGFTVPMEGSGHDDSGNDTDATTYITGSIEAYELRRTPTTTIAGSVRSDTCLTSDTHLRGGEWK